MAKAERVHAHPHKSYSKRMSDHVAYALVVYTLMLIFVVTPTIESKGTSIFPYFMLVVLVAAVIPACRGLERRWQALEASELAAEGLETRFGVDRVKLWVGAIIIPIVLSVLFTLF